MRLTNRSQDTSVRRVRDDAGGGLVWNSGTMTRPLVWVRSGRRKVQVPIRFCFGPACVTVRSSRSNDRASRPRGRRVARPRNRITVQHHGVIFGDARGCCDSGLADAAPKRKPPNQHARCVAGVPRCGNQQRVIQRRVLQRRVLQRRALQRRVFHQCEYRARTQHTIAATRACFGRNSNWLFGLSRYCAVALQQNANMTS
jgi:hypothetical protein